MTVLFMSVSSVFAAVVRADPGDGSSGSLCVGRPHPPGTHKPKPISPKSKLDKKCERKSSILL
ncbi:hypothetical protein PR002_g22790 [Phytophthora rubi]|uniref:RxLR effector protein n=1 Tax=Phytophthora rubi TaxID=129364 RepID=A0A6A3IPL7_9STRA|nr:hypothetical protein PR002_g22790 [Phytophthora rubi]